MGQGYWSRQNIANLIDRLTATYACYLASWKASYRAVVRWLRRDRYLLHLWWEYQMKGEDNGLEFIRLTTMAVQGELRRQGIKVTVGYSIPVPLCTGIREGDLFAAVENGLGEKLSESGEPHHLHVFIGMAHTYGGRAWARPASAGSRAAVTISHHKSGDENMGMAIGLILHELGHLMGAKDSVDTWDVMRGQQMEHRWRHFNSYTYTDKSKEEMNRYYENRVRA